ncbi:hypothetical protein NKJ71_13970 [Mesorhizobium sp. M0050]|uniref:hypothetical protein n=1 Tax=Mesorhizobium sp. M0050 TaxID=2956861 RepID=UPI00333CC512
MCEESYGDARERVEKNEMARDDADWKNAYIGMEAAWKKSEQAIDALMAALVYTKEFMHPYTPAEVRTKIDAALALARGGK